MRSYRTYVTFIFVPYLFLIIVFHCELQLYDGSGGAGGGRTGVARPVGGGGAATAGGGGGRTDKRFHFRDLMLQAGGSEARVRARGGAGRGVPAGPFPPPPATDPPPSAPHHSAAHPPGPAPPQPAPLIVRVGAGRPPARSPPPADPARPVPAHCAPRLPPPDPAAPDMHPLGPHYVYTAYWDARLPGPPALRVFTLLRRLHRPRLYCHLPTDGAPGSAPYRTVTPQYYEMCENHNREYGGWILNCEADVSEDSPAPCWVLISEHPTLPPDTPLPHALPGNQTAAIAVPVYTLGDPSDLDPAVDPRFGVCVPPLFGHIPSTTLVEFIELTLLLGAHHLVFYTHEVRPEVHKVLGYYSARGAVTAIPWALPVPEKRIWYHGQLLAINDCLYRNMHRFSFISFNDIDEYVVPHRHANWSGLVGAVMSAPAARSAAALTFQSAFFDPLVNSNSRVLYDVESDLRTKLFSRVRSKVMVLPQRIFELGIHHVSKPVAEAFAPLPVAPDDAFVHHYRKCTTDFDPKMNCQVFARDETILTHLPTLRHSVHRALWSLKELSDGHGAQALT